MYVCLYIELNCNCQHKIRILYFTQTIKYGILHEVQVYKSEQSLINLIQRENIWYLGGAGRIKNEEWRGRNVISNVSIDISDHQLQIDTVVVPS